MLRIILLTLAISVTLGMSKKPPVVKEEPKAPVMAKPIEKPIEKSPGISEKFPEKGWSKDYETFILALLTPEMLSVPDSRMTKFCREWPSLNQEQRKQFYVDLIYSIAWPESNYDNLSMMIEGTMGKDAATGLPTVSEGLLQMSYQDAKWYSGCKFDAKKDLEKMKADLAGRGNKMSFRSRYPERDVLNPYKNLECGIFVIDYHLKRSKKEFADSLGEYWFVMKRKHWQIYQKVWMKMRERNSPCH